MVLLLPWQQNFAAQEATTDEFNIESGIFATALGVVTDAFSISAYTVMGLPALVEMEGRPVMEAMAPLDLEEGLAGMAVYAETPHPAA